MLKKQLKKILPKSTILWWHKTKAIFANIAFGFPARKMVVVGVTGTNGKTTTLNLIASILDTAGFKVGMLTTVNFKIAEHMWVNETKMTTLSPWKLQKTLAQMAKAGCQYALVEVTSHALIQNRVWGIPFDIAVFTNLTHEHLDYHKTMEGYREAKGKLFRSLLRSFHKDGVQKVSVINRDDPSNSYFSQFKADYKLKYGILGGDVTVKNIDYSPRGSKFLLSSPKGEIEINLNLPGRFNIQNALAAIAVALSQGISLKLCKEGIEALKIVPGRMERVEEGQPFTVIVDYAHTPDALKKIYETIQGLRPNRIFAILGACGDRDKTKRPILGALAGRYADFVVVTNEDPYTEDPHKIIEEVAAGVPRGNKTKKFEEGVNFQKIFDRDKAMRWVFKKATKGDLVIITGKGAEQCMVVGEKKVPWDDRVEAKKILLELGYGKNRS